MVDNKKVLLIDDDVDLITINKRILEKNGYAVSTAYNGEEGIKKAENESPDLIILDVMMTTKSEGFEVSRELRENNRTRNIPLLMLTSVNKTVPFNFEPDETWLPVDVFLDKPVRPQLLVTKVKEMIG